jgi:hypothetical protein
MHTCVCLCVGKCVRVCVCALSSLRCVCFITAGPITKLFAWGRRRVEDMCYERRRAEDCVDESAHHALARTSEHGG